MKRLVFLSILTVAFSCMTSNVRAQPVSGVPIPELSAFDDAILAIMNNFGIDSGVLAVSRDGVVVYQRGFGAGIPENTPMRLASVEKPITAAAIRKLIADGDLNWNDQVFDGPNGNNGLLPHQPFNGIWGSNNHDNITVMDLMNHQGGWDRSTAPIGDPQFKTIQIANALGVPSPANRDEIIRYMLSQPLEYTPGTNGCTNSQGNPTFCYSNFGYMVLGRIVEEVSGMSLLQFVRSRVLTTNMFIPNQEIFTGRALDPWQDPREPYYQCSNCSATNVFNPGGPLVPNPYGGFHIEAFKGHGNLVASAAPLLTYMDNYLVGVQANAGAPLPSLPFSARSFTGGMDGTSTNIWQRGDGINIVVLFSHRNTDIAWDASSIISAIIDNSITDWPTRAVDGFWVDFNSSSSFPVGGYDYPYRTMGQALAVGAGAKIRLKPGASNWTGTISHKVIIDAPFGAATIGN